MYEEFEKWANRALKNVSEEIDGICFNLYENEDNKYFMEIVGCKIDDEDVACDWPCNEITDFDTRENPFVIIEEEKDYTYVLDITIEMIKKYKKNNDKLIHLSRIATGFVDGDLYTL
ncbi:MAG: hypothetical protein K6G26_10145 [Lachnospiraceae bacterium]|nr:hypothetical protein [Lachnospiraceae bacterium]